MQQWTLGDAEKGQYFTHTYLKREAMCNKVGTSAQREISK